MAEPTPLPDLDPPARTRARNRTTAALATLSLVALVVLVGRLLAGTETVDTDGDWELVKASFDDSEVLEPLFLRIENGLASGGDGCNSFTEMDGGMVVMTTAGCIPDRSALAAAIYTGVFDGTPQRTEDRLIFRSGDTTLEYRQLERTYPEELFELLASDAPDVDPRTIPFDGEGGPPVFDRLVRLEDGGHPADFFLGLRGTDGLSLYAGLPGPRPDAAEGFGSGGSSGERAITVLAGRPAIVALAALIPDTHLDEVSRIQIEELGTLHGNLLLADPQHEGLTYTITNGVGAELVVPFEALFQG